MPLYDNGIVSVVTPVYNVDKISFVNVYLGRKIDRMGELYSHEMKSLL